MKRLSAALLSTASLSFVSLALIALATADHATAQNAAAIVIQGGTLIDGNGGAPVPNAVIVIQGNRITDVGRAGTVQVPAGAQIIDATGKFVTPGLIDSKSNWNWEYGEGFIHWGVTSAVVSGTRNDVGIADRDAVNHGIYTGPRLFQGVLNLRGGGPESKPRPDNYKAFDGDRIVHNADEARALVKYDIQSGADFIGTNDGDSPVETWAAAADEAHKAGLGIVMRCVGPETRGKECILAGADVMIHTGEIGDQIAKNPEKWKDYVGLPPDAYCDMDPAKEKDMAAFVAAHNTALEPDLMAADRGFPSMWARIQQETKDNYSDPGMMAYYPKYSIADVIENQDSPEMYLTPDKLKERACGYANHVKFLHDVVAAGGHIVAASDITQTPPGLGLHQEMDVYQVDVKMTPMQVLQSATKWPAQHFHLKDLGVIEKGKLADIDIVDADPTKDIMNMRKMDVVIKDGKVMDRGYHAWYGGWIFAMNPQSADFGRDGGGWVAGLKAATWRPNIAAGRGEAGIPGSIPDLEVQPTPGLESVYPHTVLRGSPTQTIDIKGFNFTKKSVAYVDGAPVPTQIVSRTEVKATVDANILSRAGSKAVTVKNPAPLANPEWGDSSNSMRLLVPFEFTTAWSHNLDVKP